MQSQLYLPGKELEKLLGEPLTPDAMPSNLYAGKPRLIIPTVRTSLDAGETFKLKALVLRNAPKELALYWKPLGGIEYRKSEFSHVNRGVYQLALRMNITYDFEYFVEVVTVGGEKLRFPASAPEMNQTVVVMKRTNLRQRRA
ncbi:hypothetical protein [Cohnella silvisoli]|uniref:Ig-like domain-containing protein n=1 Tax=Cohnella silvisoli TaxID=2873699 RepID=A0ABV1L1S4_9BACL|nr:hypothetical protein [Cohnella silvisoli]MCD9025403.1 hypothetical protein [Cohnella silvisoli]